MQSAINPRRRLRLGSVVLAVVLAAFTAAAATAQDEESRSTPADEPEMMSLPGEANVIQQATMDYSAGLRNVKRASKLREKAASAKGTEREKLEKKAQDSMDQAIESFNSAVRNNPKHQKAYVELGEVLRSEGRYEEAIPAYSQALQLESQDWRALHGRAEALVKIDRIPDAVTAYPQLASGDPKLAAELVASIKGWLEARRTDPKGLSQSALDEVAQWVAQRETS